MKRNEGYPFIASYNDEVIKGVIIKVTDSGTYYYDRDPETGGFKVKKLPTDFDKRKLKFSPNMIHNYEVYAKVLDYELSVVKYGMRQRKEAFLNSVLPVVEYDTDDHGDYVVLNTARADGAQLKMTIGDIMFVFPVSKYKNY